MREVDVQIIDMQTGEVGYGLLDWVGKEMWKSMSGDFEHENMGAMILTVAEITQPLNQPFHKYGRCLRPGLYVTTPHSVPTDRSGDCIPGFPLLSLTRERGKQILN
jgi:hypothetical protein